MSEVYIHQWVLPAVAFGLAAAYHGVLIFRVFKTPEKTLIGISNCLRRIWVTSMVEEKRDLLAVQTLRNWTMAATFLASTAVLIWLAMIHLTFTTYEGPKLCRVFDELAQGSPRIWLLKWSLLMLDVFFVFVNYTLAIRHFNHVGFMINMPLQSDPHITVESIARRLNKGATHHTVGMRGYYFSIPLVLWLFGPYWLLAAMILLLLFLYRLDYEL